MRGFSRQNAVLCLAVSLASGCGFAADDGAQSASSGTWSAPAPEGEWTGATRVPDSPNEPRLRNLRQLTHGGTNAEAYFSADGSKIVYRSFQPESPEELAEYRRLLEQGLVAGGRLEIFVMDADGSNHRQVTGNGASNFAPFFHPNGRQIIFSSNLHSPGGRSFALYLIDLDGAGLERVTASDEDFDGFPMFSPDGRHLAFASSRGAASPGEINVFLAEWSPDNNDQ